MAANSKSIVCCEDESFVQVTINRRVKKPRNFDAHCHVLLLFLSAPTVVFVLAQPVRSFAHPPEFQSRSGLEFSFIFRHQFLLISMLDWFGQLICISCTLFVWWVERSHNVCLRQNNRRKGQHWVVKIVLRAPFELNHCVCHLTNDCLLTTRVNALLTHRWLSFEFSRWIE